MKPSHSLREPLVVSGQSTEARGPGEGAFNHPTPRQKHKPSLGLFEFDDDKPDTMGLCGLCGFFSRIALIDIGYFNMFARRLLHFCCKVSQL